MSTPSSFSIGPDRADRNGSAQYCGTYIKSTQKLLYNGKYFQILLI